MTGSAVALPTGVVATGSGAFDSCSEVCESSNWLVSARPRLGKAGVAVGNGAGSFADSCPKQASCARAAKVQIASMFRIRPPKNGIDFLQAECHSCARRRARRIIYVRSREAEREGCTYQRYGAVENRAEQSGIPAPREASKPSLVLIDRENAARTALIGEFPRLL